MSSEPTSLQIWHVGLESSVFTAAEGKHDGGHDIPGREQPRESAYIAVHMILLWREIGIFVAQQDTYLCCSEICLIPPRGHSLLWIPKARIHEKIVSYFPSVPFPQEPLDWPLGLSLSSGDQIDILMVFLEQMFILLFGQVTLLMVHLL